MNKINFFCVFCGTSMSAPETSAAGVQACPACSRLAPVPPLPGSKSLRWVELYPPDIVAVDVIFHCPKCEARLGSDARTAGAYVYCPPCGSRVMVPHLERLVLPPSPNGVEAPDVPEATNVPEAPGAKTEPPPANIIRLTAEEMDFLNNVTPNGASPKEKATAHASHR